ncbi:MAG: LCP family protein [Chloroflexi bacterium]|nr:LCP family protein [Chloroflexota bacterium]
MGPRRAALRTRKKSLRRRRAGETLVAGLVVTGLVTGGVLLAARRDDPPGARPSPVESPEGPDEVTTLLVYGTRERAPDAGAVWMVLLTLDGETGKGSVVYIPSHTAVDVPGRGLQGVGESLGTGGAPLLLLSAENLLSVSIDRYLELSDKDAQVLLGALGPLTVDVPAEVRVRAGKDRAELLFGDGRQQLPASFLVELLYTLGIEGDDVELGTRHLAFWDALIKEYRDAPEALARAVSASGGALAESDAAVDRHARFFAALAAVPSPDLTIAALPVDQVSVGGSQLYAIDRDELTSFLAETVGEGAGRPTEETRVQLLNGNGVPGIGQQAARRLVGHGFRIFLSGNASRLDHETTLIITYDDSPQGQALAERARELLGVGEVQVSAQQQGIVDLTIVIGEDFLRTR